MKVNAKSMLSYHPGDASPSAPWAFSRGFKQALTDDVPRISRGICRYVWSPCIWQDGVRRQANFTCAVWCVLDFDTGEMTLAEAVNTFCDTVHIIGTTKSHGVDKGTGPVDRFRVALKFSRLITELREYRYAMKKITERFPADPSPKDGARFFFPCKTIISKSADGYLEEVPETPSWFERPNLAQIASYRTAGIMMPRTRQMLSTVIPVGERNTSWYRVGKDLSRMGLDEADAASRIVQSPTYGGMATRELLLEIALCVGNGFKAVAKEESDERRRQARERESASTSDETGGSQSEKET